MIAVGIFVNNERIELFDDEKISVNSSIQNINDISKVFTDYSQTFTIPASKRNNRIFKHWYENSLDSQFSTLVKADAYIELDTILFRKGKVQLESCSIVDGQPQNYSITFIGSLGSLKDKFAGLFLKDLNENTSFDISYTPTLVKDKVTTTAVSADVMFPLISSDKYWTYGSGSHDVNINSSPIRYNELFPAIRLKSIFEMIESQFAINFDGDFLTDGRFTNAYLWLKNGDLFFPKATPILITFDTFAVDAGGWTVNLTNETFSVDGSIPGATILESILNISLTVSGIPFKIHTYENGVEINVQDATSTGLVQTILIPGNKLVGYVYSIYISALVPITFTAYLDLNIYEPDGLGGFFTYFSQVTNTGSQTISAVTLPIKNYFPEIKIEDFFAGLLKMFNLTCFSEDGVNFTVEQIEDYYANGTIRDITKYVQSDNINLNRVTSYKKINFEYEKSESIVNVGFLSANGIEYGSLLYSTNNEGAEYGIKLPFEDLNFSNLQDKLQVGYALKSDLQKYIPKPVILYDYNPTGLTALTGTTYHFATALTGNGTGYTSYKAFGQEYKNGTDTFSLNFNSQQSTLTNELVTKSLYNQYYENYFANIFSFKARIFKVTALLPISILTSLKLNDRLIIRDNKFLINSMTTDLTTGEVQLELLTDFRL